MGGVVNDLPGDWNHGPPNGEAEEINKPDSRARKTCRRSSGPSVREFATASVPYTPGSRRSARDGSQTGSNAGQGRKPRANLKLKNVL